MSGSFWKFNNGFTSLSNISTILENHTINQESGDLSYSSSFEVLLKLLDENDLLQELLSNNPMLLEFLREHEVLSMLADLVINEGEKVDKQQQQQQQNKEEEESDSNIITDKENDSTKIDEKDNNKEDNDEEVDDDDDDDEEDDKDKSLDIDEDVSNITNDDEETTEERASRRAAIATEILSADVWSLTDTVMESTIDLNKLWSILDSKSPLSINLSSYFTKIMEHLLDMKCDEMITYLIENQSNLVDKFMNHLSNPPLMDFLLKLISTDKPDNSTGIIDFLQNQNLITHLINALDIEYNDNDNNNNDNTTSNTTNTPNDNENVTHATMDELLIRQSSAADFLKALITISANSTTDNSTIGPNELTRELVSYDQMIQLCNIMLKGGYALANGVGIIIEIIRKNNSDYDILPVLYITLESHPPTGRDPIYLGHLLKVFGSKISEFNKLLMKDNSDNKLKTPFGEIEPLGFERFKICELIAELLHCSNMALLNDNKGFDVVKERDELRNKMKEYDPISFKYNEIIVLPEEEKVKEPTTEDEEDEDKTSDSNSTSPSSNNNNDFANDTIDSFNNSKLHIGDSLREDDEEEEEPHANANLTEEQIRANPVVGDFLKIALFDTQIISNILSMFFKFPWNNFLHNVVFDIVQQILNGSMDIGFNKFLAIDLFHLGDITNKIIEGQKLCNDYESLNNGLRLGFMGHLTLIAEEVVKFIQLYPTSSLSELIDIKVEDEIWEDYVNNVLFDTREKYNAILGGGEEDEEDEEDENTTFDDGDNGINEIIEEVKSGLVFDPNVKDRILDSDESESDDDDHFTNYMTSQLTNTAANDITNHATTTATSTTTPALSYSANDVYEDTDDYVDPNDDGLSYKKSHPLYDSSGLLRGTEDTETYSSEDSSSSSENDDSDEEGETEENDSNGTKLTRAASKG
ncbi:SIT4-associating protein ser/thr phosphatase [Scheffersomyces coipomensis]|uniref:SIT4-associating protein ser/thr phosphatase n=1 Tax=Scheffersomyces coipomensis TaxID=1788519 RepID=UPI00315CB3AA